MKGWNNWAWGKTKRSFLKGWAGAAHRHFKEDAKKWLKFSAVFWKAYKRWGLFGCMTLIRGSIRSHIFWKKNGWKPLILYRKKGFKAFAKKYLSFMNPYGFYAMSRGAWRHYMYRLSYASKK